MQQLSIETVPFEDILLNAHGLKNGRTSLGDITSLKDSIEQNGLMDPPVVWRVPGDEDEEFVLIAGYRRHAAITALREETPSAFDMLQVSVFEGDLDEALAKNLEENVQRQNLNPADEAEAVYNLYDRIGNQTEVGEMLGMSQGWVSQRVSMYTGLIPRALTMLRENTLKVTDAMKISKLLTEDKEPDVEAQNEALDKIEAGDKDIKIRRKRNKTYRTKKEFEELEKKLSDAIKDEEVDPQHGAILKRMIAWHRCQIDDDALIFEEVEVDDEEVDEDDFLSVEEETERQSLADF